MARTLLGQKLVRIFQGHRLAGIIIETEAYLGEPDLAAHTAKGRKTPRNHSMWLDGGMTYVYFTYGMHHCFNVVTQTAGTPTAVLIRAIEPVEGIEVMAALRRITPYPKPDTARPGVLHRCHKNIGSGPARLTEALAIDRSLDGVDLVTSDTLYIEQVRTRALPTKQISIGPRIGVDYAGPWAAKPLRFCLKGHPLLSRPIAEEADA